MEDHSAGADHRTLADFGSRKGDRADPDMGKRMYRHPAAQQDTRREMDVIADSTVVLDYGGCVHDAILPDPGTRIDYDSRHDDGPILKPGRLRYHRGRVDECDGMQAVFEGSLKACGPHFVVSNGRQILGATFALQRLQVPASCQDLAGAEFTGLFPANIVDEGNLFEDAHRPGDIEDDLPVAAGAPQHQVTHFASTGLRSP
jgi:hypothetical protein